jgi:hypothetical protein
LIRSHKVSNNLFTIDLYTKLGRKSWLYAGKWGKAAAAANLSFFSPILTTLSWIRGTKPNYLFCLLLNFFILIYFSKIINKFYLINNYLYQYIKKTSNPIITQSVDLPTRLTVIRKSPCYLAHMRASLNFFLDSIKKLALVYLPLDSRLSPP